MPEIHGLVRSGSWGDWENFVGSRRWGDDDGDGGKSARRLARSWQPPQGLAMPDCVGQLFGAEHPRPTLHHAFIEKCTSLDSSRGRSVTDLMAYFSLDDPLSIHTVMAVEGKMAEPFDETVAGWISPDARGHENRLQRLQFLNNTLGDAGIPADSDIMYQLIHRTAAAVLEARLVNAKCAIMLVQSFLTLHHPTRQPHFDQFTEFVQTMRNGAQVNPGELILVRNQQKIGVNLFCAWVDDQPPA